MPYSTVTKPSVGDPIKLSTIEGIIDNQEHFQASIAANTGFNADGSFESAGASGSQPALGWTEVSGNALTIERSNTSSDPNIHGEYTLKFSGSFGQTGGVESGLFPVSELETYFINASCQVANAADKFEVQFVSYERDGSTSVQTVSNPFFTDANNSVSGWADSSMIKQAWPVNAGPDARFAKIRILFTVNSSVASEGYFDNLTIETIKSGQYNWVTQNFYGDLGGSGSVIVNNTLTMYIPETIVYLFAVLESGVTDASFIPWYVNQGGGQQGGTYPITYPSTSFNATTRILTINSGTNGNTNYDFYVLFKPKYTYDQYPGTTAD